MVIKYSLQKQIHFNGNVFENKCCHCNEGSLYSSISSDTVSMLSDQNFCCPDIPQGNFFNDVAHLRGMNTLSGEATVKILPTFWAASVQFSVF